MRCWPSSERTTNPSSRRKRQDSLSLSLVLFPPKPLRWVSAGALLGEVIRLPFCIFSAFLCGVGITTLRLLWLCRNNPARGLFRQKNGFLRVGALCRRTRCSLLHTALFWHLYAGGGIITLGVRFMPLKRWTPAGHDGVFAVFMLPRNSPCVGRISPRRVQRHPSPNRAHSGSQGETRGGFPARDIGRVDRVNSLGTLCIVTFGTAQLNEPLSVAAAHHGRNADFA